VNHSRMKWIALVFALAAMLMLGACKKKVAPPPPPPPPPPAAPTASLSANPATIQAGQSTTLSWQTTNATDVTIDALGSVAPSGSQTISPQTSTTYNLTAKGAGGSQNASARVTVTQPPPPPPPTPSMTEAQMFAQSVHDIYFDYDKYDLRPDQIATAQADAQWLAAHPNVRFTIEGHCDERGSEEYNMGLGDRRAAAAKDYLVEVGIPSAQLSVISYGKERPVCTEHDETCWQKNRRIHIVAMAQKPQS